ncbi:MAG: phytoene desaturase [Cytophagales bacterium]|nr:MAG: phytoene desaturase [Cytophagales bacterium]
MSKGKKVIIIGSGIAGLAVAIRLRKLGFEVLVLESNTSYGGKASNYTWQDYRFDCGPSLFTLPQLVDELWLLCNKNPRDYLNYQALKIVTKYFYENNLSIDSYSSPKEFAKEIKTKLNIEEGVVLKFLKKQEETYNNIAPVFLENSIHKIGKLFRKEFISPLIYLIKPRFLASLNTINQKYFKHSALVRLFNRQGTYNGSNPYKISSLFNIISHLEHNLGAYLPDQGIYAIPQAMYKLALEEGVKFEFNQKVEEIIYSKNKVNGIRSLNQSIDADIVVSNMDVKLTYERLLPNYKAPTKYLNNEISNSALIFHWAINKHHPELEVHNILFSEDYKREFVALFEDKVFYADPTIYIYISSKIVNSDAPEGSENWFVMINAPHLTESYEKNYVEKMKKIITEKINKRLNISIENDIAHEHVITPECIASQTNSYLGSLYGASSNSMLSAFWRHPNFSNFENLYFCGCTVHPGGGIPLCLFSAKITANLIEENH